MSVPAHGAAARHISFERERGVYEISSSPDVAHVTVSLDTDEMRVEQLTRVFRVLADASIPIFLIKLHRKAVSFAVAGMHVSQAEECLKGCDFEYNVRRDLALVVVVASSMRDLTGVMVSIADSLQGAGAKLYGTGDSHNTVQCLIDGDRSSDAIGQLKSAFGLEDE